jgi:hypothetical protein
LLLPALACIALLPLTAAAQEAQVRVRVSAQEQVWVGQGVTLKVDLLAPGYFASAANFDLPDPQGVLLMPPAGHPLVSTEIIDGTQYSVQAHEVRAWPMRAGELTIPAFSIRFSFKREPLDTDVVPVKLSTSAIPLTVAEPAGADGLGSIISARQLEVKETWSPEPGTEPIKAGAAFTRVITFTAPDVPGMVFPPFPAGKIDGLGLYAKRQLLDQNERGTLVGKRRDEITYVAKRPGQFTIPAVQYTWFDLDTQQLRTEALPARTLNVIANPQMASANNAGMGDTSRYRWTEWLYALRIWSQSRENIAMLGFLMFVLLATLLPASRRRLGRCLRSTLARLHAVHLQPLNPTGKGGRRQRT